MRNAIFASPRMVEDSEIELAELLKEVRRIEVQSRRLVTDLMAGGYTSVFRGSGMEFNEVREYAEGDDPRMIDWNVTARMGRPYIKKYRDERELSVLFLLDLSASMTGGFGLWSARQMAARMCACLALSAVRNNDKVGLIAFGRDVRKILPPMAGLGHALRIVRDSLALPGRTGTDLCPPLEMARKLHRRKSIVFVVSDFLGPSGSSETDGWRRAMALCARRHDVVAVRLLSPELAPIDSGLLRLQDPETGRHTVVDWSNARVREEWAARTARWRDHTADVIQRAGADLMDVPIPRHPVRDAVAGPILKFFRMREQRSAKG